MMGGLVAFLTCHLISRHLKELPPGPHGGFIVETEPAEALAALWFWNDDGLQPPSDA